jgi:GGDEF domain-containing protein
VRVAVTEAAYQLAGAETPRLSVSVGIAPCPPGQDRLAASALVQTTERALAHARALGGNRVVVTA